jgi:hypothetical protein
MIGFSSGMSITAQQVLPPKPTCVGALIGVDPLTPKNVTPELLTTKV